MIKEDIWYHGTGYKFDRPDLDKCNKFRDFGKGFYLSRLYEHARSIAFRRSKQTKEGYIYSYQLGDTNSLKIKEFNGISLEWLEFVLSNRANNMDNEFDIIVGPIANISTVIAVHNYRDGIYGEVGSDDAKQVLMGEMKSDAYFMQMCICTDKGLSVLKQSRYVGGGL